MAGQQPDGETVTAVTRPTRAATKPIRFVKIIKIPKGFAVDVGGFVPAPRYTCRDFGALVELIARLFQVDQPSQETPPEIEVRR